MIRQITDKQVPGHICQKIYKNILHKQLNAFLETKLSLFLCDFRSRYSTITCFLKPSVRLANVFRLVLGGLYNTYGSFEKLQNALFGVLFAQTWNKANFLKKTGSDTSQLLRSSNFMQKITQNLSNITEKNHEQTDAQMDEVKTIRTSGW